MSGQPDFVTVVGAGPSGLLLSLLLAQAGIAVTLIEKSNTLDRQPRATHYAGPATNVLRRAKVAEDVEAKGFLPNMLTFRTHDNKVLTSIDHRGNTDLDKLICLPLNDLGDILLSHLQKQPNATILWGHEVINIKEDTGYGVIEVSTSEGPKEIRSKYVVGCDGANSKIRRALFGDMSFPGKTWDTQIVATNAYYDFHKFGYEDANFIIDPEHWYMASRITKDGLWRVSYGVPASMTKDELLAQQAEKWRQMLPGNPSPEDYKITNFSPYKVHQRLATSMRSGPFILAADAAHLCNPFGGLGLTGGIVDVGGLFDCLLGLYEGKADDSILDMYAKVRAEKYQQFVDPISSSNLVRMYDKDPSTIMERDDFLQMVDNARTNPELAKTMISGIDIIKYDFTQHYNIDDKELVKNGAVVV